MKRIAAPLLLILLGVLFYSSTGYDDSHITYWPSHTLASYGEILNYNGDRIEQSSSMTMVLMLAALHALTGLDLTMLGPLLSILMGAATVLAVYSLGNRFDEDVGWSAALLTATSVYLIYWSFSGMETSLTAFLSLILILVLGDYLFAARAVDPWRLLIVGTVMLFCLLVRPEMFVVLAFVLLGMVLLLKISGKRLAGQEKVVDSTFFRQTVPVLVGLTILLFLIIVVGRMAYFGKLLPQPALSKIGAPLDASFFRGSKYVFKNLMGLVGEWRERPPYFASLHIPVMLVALIGLWAAVRKMMRSTVINEFELLSFLFLCAYGSFIILSGGDWMAGGRFLAHFWPFVMLYAAVGAAVLAQKYTAPSGRILAALLACQIGLVIIFARTGSTGMPLWEALAQWRQVKQNAVHSQFGWFDQTNRVHARDLPVVLELQAVSEELFDEKGDDVVVLSAQMGLVAYYLAYEHYERVYLLDLQGLIGDDFTDCPNLHDLPVSPLGTSMPVNPYFELEEALQEKCSIPVSDVWFDLGDPDRSLADNEFKLVFHHIVDPYSEAPLFPGMAVFPEEFIAVREDKLHSVGSERPVASK